VEDDVLLLYGPMNLQAPVGKIRSETLPAERILGWKAMVIIASFADEGDLR
jgi:hypothetical protein